MVSAIRGGYVFNVHVPNVTLPVYHKNMNECTQTNYSVWDFAVDVGQCSTAFSAVEYKDNKAHGILAAVTWIHDGGKDNSPGKSPRSRKAVAGEKRRQRKREAGRKERLEKLRNTLESRGIPCPNSDDVTRNKAWADRSLLIERTIADEREMKECLGRAVMHIAHHKGWRNPWLSVEQVSNLPVPSSAFRNIKDHTAKTLSINTDEIRTLGQLGHLSVTTTKDHWVRFRPKINEETGKITTGGLVLERIRQEDLIEELRLICETQGLSDELFKTLRSAVFDQAKPTVGKERVGRDPFDKSQLRAHRATLEFQEFRIRDKVANLRIKDGNTKKHLTKEAHEQLVERLLRWDDEQAPTWEEVAEPYGLLADGERLIDDSADGTGSNKAPVDKTSLLLRRSGLAKWWAKATPDERAEFVVKWVDPVRTEDPNGPEQDIVAEALTGLTEKQQTELENLKFSSGRSAYSRESLRKLNEAMARLTCDQTTARWEAFENQRQQLGWDTEEDAKRWTPPKATFDELTGDPTVDINIALARRFLMTATAKWGPPRNVVIEHSRDGFKSPKKAQELIKSQERHREENNTFRTDLAKSGQRLSNKNVQRQKRLQRQNSKCLYCGTEINFDNSQFDHIVCRATGGSNRESNLVLICQDCNRSKNDKPFGLWAKNNSRGVTLEATIARVKAWNNIGMSVTTKEINGKRAAQGKKPIDVFGKFQADVISRLKRVTNDDPIDERSMESTAWAALAVRERIEDFLERLPGYDKNDTRVRVHVYNGSITSLAREASGFSKTISLRDHPHKTRVDRRHHALDAIILSSLTPSVARTLAKWSDRKDADELRNEPTKGYQSLWGETYVDQACYSNWLENTKELANRTKMALEADSVPVVYMSRMRPYVDEKYKLQEAKGNEMDKRRIGDAFSADEIRRVVDRHCYMALLKHPDLTHGFLGVNASRTLTLPSGRVYKGGDTIELFPRSAAMLATREGAVELHYIHHARVYAWKVNTKSKTKMGKSEYKVGIIRVFAGEFGRIGFLKKRVDVFHQEIPIWSESWRTADSTVVKMIQSGEAKQIGWLVDGDELEFDNSGPLPGKEGTPLRSFSKTFPDDRRWVVTGFASSTTIRLRPSYLSEEDLVTRVPNLPKDVTNLISGSGWRATANVVLTDPKVRILRRSILGVPRRHDTWNQEREKERLPKSWQPHLEAKRVLKLE